jgi:YD repeat-containing protein
MVDASGVTTYRYDNRNRLIEKVTPQGKLFYAYDANGNVTNIHSSNVNGKTDEWKPIDPALIKSPPEHNLGPVDDWLDVIEKNREPECSGKNGAWAVEMVMAVYNAALGRARIGFPLADRTHPLRFLEHKV